MILINGEQRDTLEITDRGLHYGDGLFETIEIVQGQPVFLTQHLARLKIGCQVLRIPYPKEALLLDEIHQICHSVVHGVVKLMLTRGSGGRGYRQPETILATRLVFLYPFPRYPANYKNEGIKAHFCTSRLGLNPVLAGIKHNNRLEQVLARAEWQDEFQEGLMLNLNEHVIEGTMTNLFVVKDGVLYTPEIILSGVKGVLREIILEIAKINNIPFKVTSLTQDFILLADELFVTNSVIGIWPIKSLTGKSYTLGPWTQKIIHYLAEYKISDQGMAC
ncbi:MAG: aminodeoxychorismate lyase [Methyloprofundus sp.]|nr:aminodeoxychorismate lyase [Methyloprofundus sp.]MDT8425422.1 aminodeoxychorismate lyase [Methyloprofundus sp.]